MSEFDLPEVPVIPPEVVAEAADFVQHGLGADAMLSAVAMTLMTCLTGDCASCSCDTCVSLRGAFQGILGAMRR